MLQNSTQISQILEDIDKIGFANVQYVDSNDSNNATSQRWQLLNDADIVKDWRMRVEISDLTINEILFNGRSVVE